MSVLSEWQMSGYDESKVKLHSLALAILGILQKFDKDIRISGGVNYLQLCKVGNPAANPVADL